MPRDVERLTTDVQCHVPIEAHADGCLDQVHPGVAEKRGDVERGRTAVHLGGRTDVLQHAAPHDRDPIGHRERLGLVVGDVHRGDAERPHQRGDLGAQLGAQSAVEIGQRLVHQEQARAPDDRPAHRDPLALATGELPGLATPDLGQTERGEHLADLLIYLGLFQRGHPQRKRDVFLDGHMRIEREVLKHHRNLTIPRVEIVGFFPVDQDAADGRRFETGDHPQHSGLSAAGWPEEHHEFAVVNVETHPVDRDRAVRKGLADVAQCDRGHR